MSTAESALFGIGTLGAVATGDPWMGSLAQLVSTNGGIKGAMGRKANGIGNAGIGMTGFMSGYSDAASTGKISAGSIANGAITGFMTGGPIGGLIGAGSSVIGGWLGKGKHKEEKQPKQFQSMEGPEDVMWATKKYVRRAAEGGREGLPLGLGSGAGTRINSNMTVNFARIEIVSRDPRSAGSEFVAGMTEGPAKALNTQIAATPSNR